MKFSDRIGKTKPPTELLRENVSHELTNGLWSAILETVILIKRDYKNPGEQHSPLTTFFRRLWIDFFKWAIDTIPVYNSGFEKQLDKESAINITREWFYKANWYEKLNFVEFISTNEIAHEVFNAIFEMEFSAYRFVHKVLLEINSEQEIKEIEKALNNSDKFSPIKVHLTSALKLLSDKRSPDYRNSIKESISAVESLCKIILGNNDTLGKALSKIEKKHQIPPTLKSAFSTLYGYTSEEGGIRHGLLSTDISVGIEEARFMLIACSAFTNYLICKM